MLPPKREKAKVQEILKNPTQSNQPALRYKKEGLWGWLSYLGFALFIILPLAKVLAEVINYNGNSTVIDFPFYLNNWIYFPFLIGLILLIITMWLSPYHFSKIIKWIYFGIVCIMFCLLGYFFDSDMVGIPILGVLFATWGLILVWYIHYFYKKSRDGYRRVWLKVLLFSIFPFLPLLYYHTRERYMPTFNPNINFGDTLGDPSDYGYPEI